MPRPFHFSRLRNPQGTTRREWLTDLLHMKSKGWLTDPGPLPDDPLRSQCLSLCRRPRCKRAKRCKFKAPLALREHRHVLFKQKSNPDVDLRLILKPGEKLWRSPKSPLARKRGEPRIKSTSSSS